MILNVGIAVKDTRGNSYLLDEIIGRGAFGYVFKAHREKDNEVFAVKTSLPSFGDSLSAQSFKNEIMAATKVVGANVIHYEYVHDGYTFPEYPPYIIMEYADGGTLKQALEKRKASGKLLTNDELTPIFVQLAEGMRIINQQLVHRDVKPDNILVCNGVLKISDFGLSKVAAEQTRSLSFKGGGTPLYMAPEAWDFSKNTLQMDIYSMGVIFYELASLQYPYSLPKDCTVDDCKAAHLYSSIESLPSRNPNLSPHLVSIINRMLEKSTKRRFSSWDEILQHLKISKAYRSPIDEKINDVVLRMNAIDLERQRKEAAKEQAKKELEEHIKLIQSQIENSVITPIKLFADKVNEMYAGKEKWTYPDTPGYLYSYSSRDPSLTWSLTIPPSNRVSIEFEIILEKNHTRTIPTDAVWGMRSVRKEHYCPCYKNKKILAWGKIVNNSNLGYNLLLLDSGEIYGDWVLMNNKNNFSAFTDKQRPEPFAFNLEEFPDEIDRVQITHLYQTEFIEFNEDKCMNIVSQLSS